MFDQNTDSNLTIEEMLAKIVDNEGRQKYNNEEDAIKALQHSQTHISTIESENKELKEKLSSMESSLGEQQSIKDMIESLTKANKEDPREDDHPTNGFDESKVMGLVDSRLKEIEASNREASNISSVKSALESSFGDKAAEVFEQKAKELNTSKEALTELAKTSPDLVKGLFKQNPKTSSTPSTSSLRVPETPKTPTLPEAPKNMRTDSEKLSFIREIRAAVEKELGVE